MIKHIQIDFCRYRRYHYNHFFSKNNNGNGVTPVLLKKEAFAESYGLVSRMMF
jgi:hypothetical protein